MATPYVNSPGKNKVAAKVYEDAVQHLLGLSGAKAVPDDLWLPAPPASAPTTTYTAPGPPTRVAGVPDDIWTGGVPPIVHLADPPKVGEPPPPPGTDTSTTPGDDAKTKSTYDSSIDYSKLFDFFGLPSDIKQKIQDLIAQAQGDVGQATPLVLGYIRGTDWYAKTYTGIQYGIASGQFGANPETDYRQFVNSANQYYQQYLTRAVSTDEITNALKEGVDVSVLGKRLEGQSYANANSAQWQYESGAFGTGPLSSGDLTALGQESVGLKSSLGDRLNQQMDQAHKRLQTIFQGTLATPNLSKTSQGRINTGAANDSIDIGA